MSLNYQFQPNHETEDSNNRNPGDTSHSSSLFKLLDGVDYGFKYTRGAKLGERYAREVLAVLRPHTTNRAVSECYPYKSWGYMPELDRASYQNAPFIFSSCQNKNVCPVCARKHGARCRKKLLQSLDHYFEQGHVVWSQTLDMGFSEEVGAPTRYKTILKSFSRLLKLTATRRLRKRNAVAYFRVVEEKLIEGIWTPHIHVLWVFRPNSTEQEVAEFIDHISRSWRSIRKSEPGVLDNERTVFSKQLEEQDMVITAWYLHKSFFLDGMIAAKPTRQKVKPLDFLIDFVTNSDMGSLEIWNQYEAATFGLRKYKFSKNWAVFF